MRVDARGKLPGVVFLTGVVAVIVSTFLPWREAMPPHVMGSLSSYDRPLVGLAAVWAGVVGLVVLIRGSNVRLALLGILVALTLGLTLGLWIVTQDYTRVVNEHISSQLTLIPDIGPGPYVSAIGVLVMLIGSVIGLAMRGVAAATTTARDGQTVSPERT